LFSEKEIHHVFFSTNLSLVRRFKFNKKIDEKELFRKYWKICRSYLKSEKSSINLFSNFNERIFFSGPSFIYSLYKYTIYDKSHDKNAGKIVKGKPISIIEEKDEYLEEQ
jgi:hypothetical protein